MTENWRAIYFAWFSGTECSPSVPGLSPHIAAVSAGDGCAKAHRGDPAVTGPAPRARWLPLTS